MYEGWIRIQRLVPDRTETGGAIEDSLNAGDMTGEPIAAARQPPAKDMPMRVNACLGDVAAADGGAVPCQFNQAQRFGWSVGEVRVHLHARTLGAKRFHQISRAIGAFIINDQRLPCRV